MTVGRSRVVEHDSGNIPVCIVHCAGAVFVNIVVAYIVPALEGTHLAVASGLTGVLSFPSLGIGEHLVEVHTEELVLGTLTVVGLHEGADLVGHARIPGERRGLTPTDIVGVSHADTVLSLRHLGCDEDNTESGTGTVNRSGGSILEHGDVGDIVRVEIREVFGGNTVDNNKRRGSAMVGESTDTADLHLRCTVEVTVGVGNCKTGDSALEGLGDVSGRTAFHRAGHVDSSDGAGEVSAFLGAVTDGNELVEHFSGRLEVDCHVCLSRHRNCLVTHVTDNDRSAGGNFKGEVTVDIRGSSILGALLNNTCTDYGLIVFIKDGTANHAGRLTLRLRLGVSHGDVHAAQRHPAQQQQSHK